MRRSALILTLLTISALASSYYVWTPSASIAIGYIYNGTDKFNPYYAGWNLPQSTLATDLSNIFGYVPLAKYYEALSNGGVNVISGLTDQALWQASVVPSDVGIVLLDTGVRYDPTYFACQMTGTAPAALVNMLNQLGVCGDYGTITWSQIKNALGGKSLTIFGTTDTFTPPDSTETLAYCVTNSATLKEIGIDVASTTDDTVIILQPTSWTSDDVGHGTAVASLLCGQEPNVPVEDSNGNVLGYANIMMGPARGAKVFVVNTEAIAIVLSDFAPNLTAGVTTPTVLLAEAASKGVTMYIDYSFSYLGPKAAMLDYLMSLNDASSAISTWTTDNSISRLVLLPEIAALVDSTSLQRTCVGDGVNSANTTAYVIQPPATVYNILQPSNTNPQSVTVPSLYALTSNYIAIVAPAGNEGEDVANTLNPANEYVAPAQCYMYIPPSAGPLVIVAGGVKLAQGVDTGHLSLRFMYVDDKYGNYDFTNGTGLYRYWFSMPAASTGTSPMFTIVTSATNGTVSGYVNITLPSGKILSLSVVGSIPSGGGSAFALGLPLTSLTINGTVQAQAGSAGTSLASALVTADVAILLNDPSIATPLDLKGALDALLYDTNTVLSESSNIGYGPVPTEWAYKYFFLPKGIQFINYVIPLPSSSVTTSDTTTMSPYPGALPGSAQPGVTVTTMTMVINGQTTTIVTTIGGQTERLSWQMPFVFAPIPVLLRKLGRKSKKVKK